MAETIRVWVRTSTLDKIIHGKVKTTNKRPIPGVPISENSEIVRNWGWSRSELVKASSSENEGELDADAKEIKVYINDSESPYDRREISLPGSVVKEGNMVMANVYGDGLDEDEDESDEDGYYGELEDTFGAAASSGSQYPDDLIVLTHLHEPSVVYCLRKRYSYDKIYTATGPILLALNPFKNCASLYNDVIMKKYWNRGERSRLEGGGSISSSSGSGNEEEKKSESTMDYDEYLPPHVYGIADNSFRMMMTRLDESSSAGGGRARGKSKQKSCNQAILVSGESGAGKTVTTKFIMKYLATLSKRSTGPSERGMERSRSDKSLNGAEKPNIEQQVLQSNPILESFGNARTIRNDNSSRFGKFIEIQFTSKGSLVGANIETYLLEKVRLITQAEGERNYHIFYELLQGMPEEELDDYFLSAYTAEDFKMTNTSGTYDRRDGVEDSETYLDLIEAMETMGFTKEEKMNMFNVTCALLHLSNATFNSLSEDESEIDRENSNLTAALTLLGVSCETLNRSICYFSITAGKEKHLRSLSKEKAEKGIEALIKATYGALFHIIVKRVNESIGLKSSGGRSQRSGSKKFDASIGVLDIFGFESFRFNSFEQLCINYCNEALQQQFNLFVLKNEQEEYEREGIKWSFISFPENQDVLDLIDKKGCGILSILDDQCRAPGTTDKTFANDLYGKCTGHNRFQADFRQVGARKFAVIHYAGTVEYSTEGFVQKNRDELPKESTELLMSSTNAFVKDLATIISGGSSTSDKSAAKSRAPPGRGRGASSGTRVTVGGQFSKQLKELREKIDLTSPHYVRCLKPNDELVPDTFDPVIVADQLRCAGVVEAVRVSRVGYPQRYSHSMFVSRYRVLGIKALKKAARSSRRQKPVTILVNAIAEKILSIDFSDKGKELKQDMKKKDSQKGKGAIDLVDVGMQVGKTKVFLRRKAYEILERLRNREMRNAAVKIQTTGRRYIAMGDFKSSQSATIKIQCCARRMMSINKVHELRRNYNATVIQSFYRKCAASKSFNSIRFITQFFQRLYRGSKGRERYETLNQIRKAKVLQTFLRCHYFRKLYDKQKEACLSIQCAVRCAFARIELRSLKASAKNLQATAQERDQLKRENLKLKNLLKEANLKANAEEASMLNKSSQDSKEVIEMQHKLKLLQDQFEESQSQNDIAVKMLSEAQACNGELKSKNEMLDAQISKITKDLHDKDLILEEKTEQLAEAGKRIVQFQSSLDESQKELSKISQHEKELLEQLQTSKENNDNLLLELDVAKSKINEQKDEIPMVDQSSADTCEKVEKDEYDSISRENERLEQEVDTLMNKLAILAQEHSNVEKLITENKKLKSEVEKLRENRNEDDNDNNSSVLTPSAQEDNMGVFTDLREQNEEMQDQLQKSINELRQPMMDHKSKLEEDLSESPSGECSLGHLTTIQEVGFNDSANFSKIKSLENEISVLTNKLEEYESLDQSMEIRTLQDEVTRLNNEIKDLRVVSNNAEEVLTLQDEIQRLNKELATTKTTNGENDRYNAINTSKQFDQMGRLIDAVMAKDIEIRDLKNEINALNEKNESLSNRSPHPSRSSHDDDDDDDDRSVVSRLFGRHSKLPLSPSSTTESPNYKMMYDQLKLVNETMRKNLEDQKKECNLIKFKLREEKERSAKDLEAFAESLRGVDELRTAAERMSRELKQRDQGAKNYSSGARESFNAAAVLDKLEVANSIPLSQISSAEGETWAGVIKTMTSLSGQHHKNKKKGRSRKRRGSGNASVISSFF